MNRLTQQEFQDRIEAVAEAREIFIDLTDGRIDHAFALYQGVLARKERAIIIDTLTSGNRTRTPLDNFERPKCPDCGAGMLFRPLAENPEGIKTQLVCENPECDIVLNSSMSIEEWAKELQDAGRPEQAEKSE